jgi:hypothetical protein
MRLYPDLIDERPLKSTARNLNKERNFEKNL